MATIPLPNMPQTPGSPGPVMQPQKRIQIDPSGVFAAAREANMQPLMPAGMFDNGAAGKAWGEALQTLGQLGMELYEKEAQAKTDFELEEARTLMEGAFKDQRVWQQENAANPDTWLPRFEETFNGVTKKIQEKGYSSRTMRRLSPLMDHYRTRYAIEVDGDKRIQTLRMAEGALTGGLLESIDSQDQRRFDGYLERLSAGGHVTADQVTRYKLQFRDTGRQKANDEARSLYSTAILTSDEALMERAIELGKSSAGWTDADATLMRTKGARDMAEVREQAFADSERDALGEIAFRMASGETVTPSQIDGLVKSRRISPGRASVLMEAAKREDRPLPSEWDPFIDEVKTYDPDDDPKKEKIRDLINKMIFLNPDRGQAEQFNGVLQDAVAQNTDRNKLVETQLLVAARNQIRDSFAKGGIRRAWNKDLEMALQDTAKLEAFGIPTEKAQEIKALMQGTAASKIKVNGKDVVPDLAAAFREFKTAATTRRDKSAAGKAGLSSWAYDLFERAATSDASGDFNDPQKAQDAALDEAVLLDQLNQWFRSETLRNKGVPPDEMAVKKKLGVMINGALQGSAARPGGVMTTPGKQVSIRGFEEAPNLESRLPDPLKPYAADFVEAGRTYGLDPAALAAIAMHETGNGTSKAFREKNNAMGISNSSGPITLASVRDSIMQQAKTLSSSEGPYRKAKTLDEIAAIYAPVGAANDPTSVNQHWPAGVRKYYSQLKD